MTESEKRDAVREILTEACVEASLITNELQVMATMIALIGHASQSLGCCPLATLTAVARVLELPFKFVHAEGDELAHGHSHDDETKEEIPIVRH